MLISVSSCTLHVGRAVRVDHSAIGHQPNAHVQSTAYPGNRLRRSSVSMHAPHGCDNAACSATCASRRMLPALHAQGCHAAHSNGATAGIHDFLTLDSHQTLLRCHGSGGSLNQVFVWLPSV